MVVRTWNLFHGNTSPPGRRAYLREMVELITADRPTVVCLQEVPAWALKRVGDWAGMRPVAMRTRRGKPLGRRVTALNAGLFRSAFNGQGNVILVPEDVTIRETKGITLNTNPFVEEEGRKLGLDTKLVRGWEKERRVCQLAAIELPDRRRLLVANLHATGHEDRRLADAELMRAMRFVNRAFEVGETAIVAGDFNLRSEDSQTIKSLVDAPPEDRWSSVGAQIDHVLVRDGRVTASRVWSDDERTYDGKLLSDHPPVEVTFEPV
jgi:endonuclease/exonuclease/phosphatase family metal-dependent hydrolase